MEESGQMMNENERTDNLECINTGNGSSTFEMAVVSPGRSIIYKPVLETAYMRREIGALTKWR